MHKVGAFKTFANLNILKLHLLADYRLHPCDSSVIFSSDELILMSRFLSIKLRTERSREEVTPETNSSVIISSEELNLMSGFLLINSS